MSRVLVTGATGFAGQYICRDLAARGYTVIGTAMHAQPDNALNLYTLDLCDVDAVDKLIQEVKPEYVLHLAGIASPANNDKLAYFRVNTFATVTLLNACQSHVPDIKKVILTSSANVYGEPGLEVLDESLCPAPINAYGCSKLAMEHLSNKFAGSFPLQIVRPFNFTGRGQTDRFLVPKIVNHFRDRKDHLELGNIDVSRDFSDVRDVAREFADLLGADTATETVNICSGSFLKLKEIIALCEDITQHSLTISVNPAFVRANEIMRLRGSRDRLDALVGPRADRPFKETLRWMLDPE